MENKRGALRLGAIRKNAPIEYERIELICWVNADFYIIGVMRLQ
jgi:hypothetical protein